MKKHLLAGLVAGALLVTACSVEVGGTPVTSVRGSGNVITEPRSISNVNSIEFTGLGEIIISQGGSESLVIEAEDNIMPHLRTTVRNGVLQIGFERTNWQNVIIPSKTIRFTLSVKDLVAIESSGLGSIQTESLKGTRLSLKLTGAGNVKMDDLDVTALTTLVGGAGNIELSGKAGEQTVTLSGLGSYRAGSLASDKAKVTISGAGSATVWPRDTLDVKIAGAGSVNYYGAPQISKEITGIGSVKSLGAK